MKGKSYSCLPNFTSKLLISKITEDYIKYSHKNI
jgi:hypothetical protein